MKNKHPHVQVLFDYLKDNGIPFRIRKRKTIGGDRRTWIEIPLDRVIEPNKKKDGDI